jgi:hypothetical protein
MENKINIPEAKIAALENKYKEVFNSIWEDGKSLNDLMCAVELCISESYSAASQSEPVSTPAPIPDEQDELWSDVRAIFHVNGTDHTPAGLKRKYSLIKK